MVQTPPKPPIDTAFIPNHWHQAAWDSFAAIADHPDQQKAKCYYFQSQMRVEIIGVGPNHAIYNTLLTLAIGLFCMTRQSANRGLTNASYRKTGQTEAQPDISYYFGDVVSQIPDSNSVIDLDSYPAPHLAIEIAATSLNEDTGIKRMLYESLGIQEYWVVNVETNEILAFQILNDRGSQRITESIVLPGLEIAVLETALRSRQTQDDSQIMMMLMSDFQG
jgi:Uma2 family endonuclease